MRDVSDDRQEMLTPAAFCAKHMANKAHAKQTKDFISRKFCLQRFLFLIGIANY